MKRTCIAVVWSVVFGLGFASALTADEAWNFAVICDTRDGNEAYVLNKKGVNVKVLASMAQAIVANRCELVLVPGDMVNGAALSDESTETYAASFALWRATLAPVYDAGIRVYPVRGNHENGKFKVMKAAGGDAPPGSPASARRKIPATKPVPNLLQAYQNAFKDPYLPTNGPAGEVGLTYSFTWRNALFVGLDEYVTPQRVNQPWLDAQLSNPAQPHVFVYGHEPAFQVNHADCLAWFPSERDVFWNSLGRAGVRIYFSGHDHLYNRAMIKDAEGHEIQQVVTGSGGAPIREWKGSYSEGDRVKGLYHDHVHVGFVVVTVSNLSVTMNWKATGAEHPAEWKTLDTFSYTVPPRAEPPKAAASP